MTTSHTATIRTARLDDYAAVCRLMDGVDELHRDRLPWMFKAAAAQARSETFFADLGPRKSLNTSRPRAKTADLTALRLNRPRSVHAQAQRV
jgi:hypothetical protein